jgi:hypothetical protein
LGLKYLKKRDHLEDTEVNDRIIKMALKYDGSVWDLFYLLSTYKLIKRGSAPCSPLGSDNQAIQ